MYLDIEKENYSCVQMHFVALDVARFNCGKKLTLFFFVFFFIFYALREKKHHVRKKVLKKTSLSW